MLYLPRTHEDPGAPAHPQHSSAAPQAPGACTLSTHPRALTPRRLRERAHHLNGGRCVAGRRCECHTPTHQQHHVEQKSHGGEGETQWHGLRRRRVKPSSRPLPWRPCQPCPWWPWPSWAWTSSRARAPTRGAPLAAIPRARASGNGMRPARTAPHPAAREEGRRKARGRQRRRTLTSGRGRHTERQEPTGRAARERGHALPCKVWRASPPHYATLGSLPVAHFSHFAFFVQKQFLDLKTTPAGEFSCTKIDNLRTTMCPRSVQAKTPCSSGKTSEPPWY
jgi:hypothetical protein